MRQSLLSQGLLLALFTAPAKAQPVPGRFRSMHSDQLTVGIHRPAQLTPIEIVSLPKTTMMQAMTRDESRRDSAKRPVGQHVVIGGMIGGVLLGAGAGIAHAQSKQQDYDFDTPAWVFVGFVAGAILGALAGLYVYFQH